MASVSRPPSELARLVNAELLEYCFHGALNHLAEHDALPKKIGRLYGFYDLSDCRGNE